MSQQTTTDVDLVGEGDGTERGLDRVFMTLMAAFAFVSFPNPLAAGVPVACR